MLVSNIEDALDALPSCGHIAHFLRYIFSCAPYREFLATRGSEFSGFSIFLKFSGILGFLEFLGSGSSPSEQWSNVQLLCTSLTTGC